jgi:protein-disulfide isomerase
MLSPLACGGSAEQMEPKSPEPDRPTLLPAPEPEPETRQASNSAFVPCSKHATTGCGASTATASEAESDKTIWRAALKAGDPVRGPSDALVTLVVFSDFECPYCKRVERTFEELAEEYPGKLRFVWKDYPLSMHERAEPAARLSRVIYEQKGNAAFWSAHDKLFSSQPDLSETVFIKVARDAGLRWDVTKSQMSTPETKDRVARSRTQGLKLGVDVTPTTFVNGRKVVGAESAGTFEDVIDEELERAEKLLKSGTAKNQLYAALIRDGKVATTSGADSEPAAPSPVDSNTAH